MLLALCERAHLPSGTPAPREALTFSQLQPTIRKTDLFSGCWGWWLGEKAKYALVLEWSGLEPQSLA